MIAVVLPVIILTGIAQTPSPRPRDFVARAVAAMGGEPALRGLRSLTLTGYTATFGVGQEETPASPARATLTIGTQATDYAGNRQATVTVVRNVAGAVNNLRRITTGGIGMLETNGVPAPDNPAAVANVERGMRRAPERLLIAALDNPAAVRARPARTWRGETLDGVRYASGPDTLDVYFDRRSGLPVLTQTITDDPILGDRRTLTAFTRWQDAGDGMLYPRQHDIEVNGRLQTHAVFTAAAANRVVPDSLFLIPDSITARAQRSNPTPPPIVVALVELAPNVWRAEGGSHHTLVVDQGARLVIVEAPQSALRMEAVLDTLRARFAGKPIGLVINTHHHWDHAGGLRTVMAAGLPVVTHARNAGFVRAIAAAPKTVRPDSLSRRPRRPTVTTVEDSLVVGTGDSRIVVYRFPTAHVEGMLTAYMPAARILFQSDVVNVTPPATPSAAGSAELLKFGRARSITVDRVAGGHGVVLPWAEVERAATP